MRERLTGRVVVSLVGDNVAMGRPEGLGFFYERIGETLAAADVRFGNLEWVITEQEGPAATFGRPSGHMIPADAVALAKAGFDVVSLANNHVMDHGEPALLETIQSLDANNVGHCGAGPDRRLAHEPAVLTRHGLRIAFLAYTSLFWTPTGQPPAPERPQMATFRVATRYEIPSKLFEQPGTPPIIITTPDPRDLTALDEDIRGAKARADVVVVSWHWGVSGGYRHRAQYQLELGHRCIDVGADLVIGHGPHMLQGVERYGRGAICYSLGDFVFWRFKHPGHDPHSMIVSASFTRSGLESVRFLPVRFNGPRQPELAEGADAVAVLEMLRRDSRDLGTKLSLRDGHIEIEA